MAISLKSLTRAGVVRPPRILVYGVEGVGKTTFAAGAPNPVFIWTEDGAGTLDPMGFPLARSFGEVMESITSLYEEDHDFQTVVTDSMDWLEPLIWAQVCADKKIGSIEDVGYGKGYIEALTHWRAYLEGMTALRNERNMTIIHIAHSHIKRFDSPETEPYDRYMVKIHDRASALLREHSDVVAFANYHIAIEKVDKGFNKTVARGVTSGKRFLYLSERPAYQAKNRYSMPEKVELDWEAFAKELPQTTELKAA